MTSIATFTSYLPLIVLSFWIVTLLVSLRDKKQRFKLPFVVFFIDALIAICIGQLIHNFHFELYVKLYSLGAWVALSMFPLFYIALVSLTKEQKMKTIEWSKHLIIPTLGMISSAIVLFGLNTVESSQTLVNKVLVLGEFDDCNSSFFYYFDKSLRGWFIISSILYFILSERQVKKHKQYIVHYFSNINSIELNWYIYFRIVFSLTLIAGILYYAIDRSTSVNTPIYSMLSWVLLSVFFWVIGYNISIQKRIYADRKIVTTKSEKSHIEPSEKIFDLIDQQLNEKIRDQKLFLDNNLTINDVARAIGTNRTYISHTINKRKGTNFNLYINTLRIEYATTLLKDPEIKLNDIYFACGFRSTSSFYRVFSEIMGTSPSKYRKEHEMPLKEV